MLQSVVNLRRTEVYLGPIRHRKASDRVELGLLRLVVLDHFRLHFLSSYFFRLLHHHRVVLKRSFGNVESFQRRERVVFGRGCWQGACFFHFVHVDQEFALLVQELDLVEGVHHRKLQVLHVKVSLGVLVLVAPQILQSVLNSLLLPESSYLGISIHERQRFFPDIFLFHLSLDRLEKKLLGIVEQLIVLHHPQVLEEKPLSYSHSVLSVLHYSGGHLSHIVWA